MRHQPNSSHAAPIVGRTCGLRRPGFAPISNRNFQLLEIAVTPTKHSSRSRSNRNSCIQFPEPVFGHRRARQSLRISSLTSLQPRNLLVTAASNSAEQRSPLARINTIHSPILFGAPALPVSAGQRSRQPSRPPPARPPEGPSSTATRRHFSSHSQLLSPPQLANATCSQRPCLTQWAHSTTRRSRSIKMLGTANSNAVTRADRIRRVLFFRASSRLSSFEQAPPLCTRPRIRASRVITHWKQGRELARLYHCDCSGPFIHYAQVRHLTVRIGGFPAVARGAEVAFVRRKGNSYFLVHNVRREGKVRQLHLARLGERPKITDDVVRRVSRNHPFLQLDWPSLREQVNNRAPVFDVRSPYVQTLMHALRNLNLDLADLTPPMLVLADRANSSRELVTQLRLLRSTLDIKLNQFERGDLAVANGGRKFR